MLKEGQAALAGKDYDKAVVKVDEALALKPNDPAEAKLKSDE